MAGEHDRTLHADDGALANALREPSVQAVHAGRVARPDGAHLDNLTVDELHAFVLGEHARLTHAVVLFHGEAVCDERHAHTIGAPVYDEQAPGTLAS